MLELESSAFLHLCPLVSTTTAMIPLYFRLAYIYRTDVMIITFEPHVSSLFLLVMASCISF